MKINAVVQLREALHPRARTAPEMLEGRAVYFEIPGRHWLKVHRHSCLWILRGQNRIHVIPLVKIAVFHIACQLEQLACQLEHVIAVAGLAGNIGTFAVQNVRLSEVLAFAIAAGNVAVMIHHHVPETLRSLQVEALAFAQNEIPVQRTEELRNRRIGMLAAQNVPSLLDRFE
ncbi:hypothetical protein D3C77_291850 [compost metagenome]